MILDIKKVPCRGRELDEESEKISIIILYFLVLDTSRRTGVMYE